MRSLSGCVGRRQPSAAACFSNPLRARRLRLQRCLALTESGTPCLFSAALGSNQRRSPSARSREDVPSQLKLIDFGFAKIWDPSTLMMASCGSIAYVSPDVLSGRGKRLRRRAGRTTVSLRWGFPCIAPTEAMCVCVRGDASRTGTNVHDARDHVDVQAGGHHFGEPS